MDNTVTPPKTNGRVGAIDLLRALTMVLMIFVNDLWTLHDIPAWLEHVAADADGMGLADVVFPAFLFIVGLSLPFAIDSRRARGEGGLKLAGHVVGRAFALVVMGVFLVNGETINNAATGLSSGLWYVMVCASFILIWNAWPRTLPAWARLGAQGLGVAVLIGLAIIYRGGEDGTARVAKQWWGILGLIGWAYLAAGLVTVVARGRLWALIAAWLAFCGLSVAAVMHLTPAVLWVIPESITGGTLTALALGGVVIGQLFRHYRARDDDRGMTLVFVAIAAALLVLGVATRPLWGISKIGATPPWLFLCSGLTIVAFTAVYWLGDVAGKAKWFAVIRPAGSDTLLCYLTPYFVYAIIGWLGLHLPPVVLGGAAGLVKSLVFAVLCVVLAGLVSRTGVRLKL